MWSVEVYNEKSCHLYMERDFQEEPLGQVSKFISLVPKDYVWVLYEDGEALDYGKGTA